jgi:hypothetical protein
MFVDSMKLLPVPLAALGKLHNFDKLTDTIDYRDFKIMKEYPLV